MTPHPERPGLGSTLIDIVLVGVIFGVFIGLALIALAVLARGVRAVSGWRRPRRWPRDGGGK